MTESREYMLSVLWRSLDPDKKVTFRDGSEHYFLPRIKMEKISDNKYELLDTTRDVYKPLEEFLVQFAYENSLKILSDSLSYSNALDRIEGQGKELSEKTYDFFKQKLDVLKNKEVTHLNQIKLNYGNKQREDSEAIQEV